MLSWAKGRKKPAPEVVSQKVEELVTKATEKVAPDCLAPEDRQRVVTGLIDVVRPTMDQVTQYSPNTAQIVYAAPVQLIAYHTAVIMGKDADQPRNLAKSVTVE